MKLTRFTGFVALLLVLLLTACSVSTIITDINLAVDAISIASPVIAAFAGPGAGPILAYTSDAAAGLNCVMVTAEAPGATTALITAAVSRCLSTIVAPQFPPGTPQNIIALVSVIVNAVAIIVTKYGPQGTLAIGVNGAVPMRLGFVDRYAIGRMQHKIKDAMVTLDTTKIAK